MKLLLKTAGPRFFAGFGTLALLASVGLFTSRPAHTAGGPVSVTVANTPLPVTTAPAQPVEVVVTASSTTSPATVPIYTVPAHKSLVVSSMSLFSSGGHTSPYVGEVTNQDSAGNLASFTTLTAPASTNSDVAAATQPMHFTVGPGGKVAISVFLKEPGGVFAYVSLSGNLIDAP